MSKTTTDRSSGQGALAHLSTSERHELLSSSRRRVAVEVLAERDGSIALESLARSIATRERPTATEETIQEISISLHHCHLPRLDDASVVDYDTDAGVVRPHEEALRLLRG